MDIIEKLDFYIVDVVGEIVLVLMNCFFFILRIFEVCCLIDKLECGEYEIVDVVCWMVEYGEYFDVVLVELGVFDMLNCGDIMFVVEVFSSCEVKL